MQISRTARKPKKQWSLLLLALPFMVAVFLFSYVPIMGWSLAFVEYKPGQIGRAHV